MLTIRQFEDCIQAETLPENLLFQLLEESEVSFYKKFGDLFCSLLLEHHPDMKAVNVEGDTLLLAAARRNNIFAVSVLLTFGSCDVEARDREGKKALAVATNPIIQQYLSKGITLLQEKPAAVYLDQDRKQLQEIYANKLTSNQMFFKLVESEEYKDDLTLLLTQVDPPPSKHAKNKYGHDIWTAARIVGNTTAVELLDNHYSKEAADLSAKRMPIAVFKEKFEDQQASNKRLLSLAEYGVNPDRLRDLLTKVIPKPNVNTRNHKGETSLLVAIKRGDETSIQPLLQSKADVKIPDRESILPMEAAIKRGSSHVVYMLLAAKADIHTKCSANLMFPMSGLEFALYKQPENLVDIVTVLLDYKADVNEKLRDGCSPFSLAIRNINEEKIRTSVAHYLIEANANICEPDEDGFTPMLYAVKNNRLDIIKILLEKGVSPTEKHQITEYDDEGVSFERSVTAWSEATRLQELGHDCLTICNEFKKAEVKQTRSTTPASRSRSATPSPVSSLPELPTPLQSAEPQQSPKNLGGIFAFFSGKGKLKISPIGSPPTTSTSPIGSLLATPSTSPSNSLLLANVGVSSFSSRLTSPKST